MSFAESKNLLNEKEAYETWKRLGSLKAVEEHYRASGLLNPKTNKPFSKPAFSFAAYRYISKNLAEVRRQMRQSGSVWVDNDDEFYSWAVRRMRTNLTPGQYKRFVNRNDLRKYADELLKDRSKRVDSPDAL